jgi:hypothetical protein
MRFQLSLTLSENNESSFSCDLNQAKFSQDGWKGYLNEIFKSDMSASIMLNEWYFDIKIV